MGSFHANSTNLEESSMGTISDFAQNCTKCASMGTMKNTQVSDQNSKQFKFYGLFTQHLCIFNTVGNKGRIIGIEQFTYEHPASLRAGPEAR